jgi:SprT-like family
MGEQDENSGEGGQAAPTADQFGAYRAMFQHFNRELFGGVLPEPLLNLSRASRKTVAFFAPDRWEGEGGATAHEISLNPAYLGRGSARETAQSLVHEMVHDWQHIYGTPSRQGYHNRQWSRKMLDIGLEPLNAKTGMPAMGGQNMSDRVVEGGPFSIAFATLPPQALLPWSSMEARPPGTAEPGSEPQGEGDEGAEPVPPSRNKLKYTCPNCATNVWGKPGLVIVCLGAKEQHTPTLFVPTGGEPPR